MTRLTAFIVSIALVTIVTVVEGNDEPIAVYGKTRRSIKLPCNIPIAEPSNVEWSDMVWTSNTNQMLIFISENNFNFNVDVAHQNRKNFRVDRDFTLTISALNMDVDPGLYKCRSIVDGAIYEREYYLTVGDMPTCSGNVNPKTDESTKLACSMTFSGQQPMMQWYHDGEPVASEDHYDIRLAKKVVSLRASRDDDKAEYVCKMTLGDLMEECRLVLNVSYLVEDVKFVPEKERFRVGEELKCLAKGNPEPSVQIIPEPSQGKSSGSGWHSIVIGQNWEGQKLTLQCIAINAVGLNRETLSTNLTIHVAGHGHINGHRKQHHSTVSMEDHRKQRHSTVSMEDHRKQHHSSVSMEDHRKQHHSSVSMEDRNVKQTRTTVLPLKQTTSFLQITRRGNKKHQHSTSTTASPQNQHDEENDGAFAKAVMDDDEDDTKWIVVYQEKDDSTEGPFIRTLGQKEEEKQIKSEKVPEVSGAKPVLGNNNSNNAGHPQLLRYSTAASVLIFVHLMITSTM